MKKHTTILVLGLVFFISTESTFVQFISEQIIVPVGQVGVIHLTCLNKTDKNSGLSIGVSDRVEIFCEVKISVNLYA